ncbi:MAG TPA: M13 family metallopeptidase [Candidatus Saccharimonadales bacterium]|nr:M13 family metallopeptidase [Candidatus Saccharimonadales bacterium]
MTRSTMRFRKVILTTLAAGWLAAAALAATAAHAAPPLPRDKDPLVQNMDPAAKPGVDFFEYSCGRWVKSHPIPAAERGWGIANLVQEEIYQQLKGICSTAARSGAPRGTSEQKVGDFWAVGMDSIRTNKQGAAPLKPYLAQIAAIRTRADLLKTIARFQVYGISPLYSLYIGQDERNSEQYLVHLYQGGLRLPDRDYYLNTDAPTQKIRAAYAKHVAAMFRLLGENQRAAQRASATVMRIETDLARKSRTLEQRRDPWANYHKMSVAELAALAPTTDWAGQFTAMGMDSVDTVIVAQPEFVAQADSSLKVVSLDDWKTYLRWDVVSSLASFLSRPFDLEHFHFYGTVLSGTKSQRPRWKRTLDAEEEGIGELMGQVWVKKYCSPATKARYEKLTNDILDAYRERIRALPWMSETTKQRALSKLDHVTRKVAYPDRWRDYSALQLNRDSYAGDQILINEWWFHHEANKLGKPVDRTEWGMTPQTYNAYYDGSKVEIVLPAAAFMLPGLPDSLVDDALLYSYAGGSTIGHEITHGFDDEGRQFDDHGNMNPWWTDQDSVQFAQRSKKLVDQFDQYTVGDKHVRGLATLGENIADLGGVILGYEAFKKTDQWKKGESVNGLTPDQRYFLGYALSWLGHRRPESLAQQIMTDVHAPQFLRVNGPLANIPEFYQAFGVKPGDPMWRPDSLRASIW